jgi:hypothetical protein
MNLIRIALTLAFASIGSHIQAQRYGCENGKVVFFSSAPVENIQATNQMVSSIFVPDNGTLVFSVPVKEFQFEKKLMQEHFNDKYMESDRFPRSTFAGTLSGYSMSLTGIQQVRAKGALTIHGIRKDVDVPGTLQVNGQYPCYESYLYRSHGRLQY